MPLPEALAAELSGGACPWLHRSLALLLTTATQTHRHTCPHGLHAGAALRSLLEAHPNLLTYAVSANGKQLEKGLARASVDLVDKEGHKVAGVSYWREGAAFATAPVAPLKPSAM